MKQGDVVLVTGDGVRFSGAVVDHYGGTAVTLPSGGKATRELLRRCGWNVRVILDAEHPAAIDYVNAKNGE